MLTFSSFYLLTSLKVAVLFYRYKDTGKRGVRKEAVGTDYRHEWKHEISYADLLAIRARTRAIMQRGIPADHILKYGFAFEGENCLILKE